MKKKHGQKIIFRMLMRKIGGTKKIGDIPSVQLSKVQLNSWWKFWERDFSRHLPAAVL